MIMFQLNQLSLSSSNLIYWLYECPVVCKGRPYFGDERFSLDKDDISTIFFVIFIIDFEIFMLRCQINPTFCRAKVTDGNKPKTVIIFLQSGPKGCK